VDSSTRLLFVDDEPNILIVQCWQLSEATKSSGLLPRKWRASARPALLDYIDRRSANAKPVWPELDRARASASAQVRHCDDQRQRRATILTLFVRADDFCLPITRDELQQAAGRALAPLSAPKPTST
jgi:hypothetical protein